MFLHILAKHYRAFRWFLSWTPDWFLAYSSKLRAWRAHWHARLNVPAYRAFIGDDYAKKPGRFESIKTTDKDNYIRPNAIESRCLHGTIPMLDTVIDESSGSSGTPYNWVRSIEERRVSHLFVSHFARYCFDLSKLITINGFSMGSWATGLNMGISMQQNGIVKNIGPDIDKILSTITFFGPAYEYLITGYPPFLKHLIDEAEQRGFPLADYSLYGLAGGEGMSEGLRDYLHRHFKKVYSGYGATDLEIGMAGESPIAVAIRREARVNPELRNLIFGGDSRLPMVFHYNPMMHYIEVTDENELVFTITRLNVLSPRIRYNIHDEGGVMAFSEMVKKCKMAGLDLKKIFGSEFDEMPKLPFMWIYGRKDSTISIMGANIYPEDLEQCLYSEPDLARVTRSFFISLREGENAEVHPLFVFEVVNMEITEELRESFKKKILKQLLALNADFEEAWHEHSETLVPEIELWPEGGGPFQKNSGRIKQIRIMK